MFKLFSSNKDEQKAYAGAAYMYDPSSQTQSTKISYDALAKEGYKMNAIAFRCIYAIKTAIAALDINVFEKAPDGTKRKVLSHPIIDLLDRPNTEQGKSEFMQELVGFYLISGNAYVYNPNEDAAPKMLYNLRPKDVQIKGGKDGVNYFYVENMKRNFSVERLTGKSAIAQIKDFDPISVWYGMSRLEAGIYSIDAFNEALKWNYRTLKNGAKPSGVMKWKGNDNPTTDQMNEAVEMIQAQLEGPNNAGKTIVSGGLEWQQMSMSPKDMDFKDNQIMAARYIAQVFGVPAQLIGLPEAQTFSNMAEAKLAFYEDTVIPIAEHIYGGLQRWLNTFYSDKNIKIEIDKDKVSALDVRRNQRSERAINLLSSGSITINEAREIMGMEKVEDSGANTLFINASQVPLDFAADPDFSDAEATKYHDAVKADDDEINTFGDSKFPDKPSYRFMADIKENYPEMWRIVGNGGQGEDRTSFTGKDAFKLWTAYNDGDRSEKVTNWLRRRESFVARFRNNVSNWQGMLALGMWAGVPSDGGFDKMKSILNEQKKKVREARD